MRQSWVRAYRALFALLTLAAVGYQFWYLADRTDDFNPVNFFSFFTIESNLFAAAILLWFVARGGEPTPLMTFLRGAAVTYMATTGVVYGLLLSGYTAELQTAIQWVDNVVHRIFPLVLVIDWLIDPPRHRVPFRRALWWLLFPAVFLVYSLIRGPLVDWYPYPFLNPDRAGGYPGVAAYCVGIALFILGMTWLVTWTGQHLRVRRADAASAAA